MTLLLAVRGNIATRSMSGPPFALQRHRSTVWCRATGVRGRRRELPGRRVGPAAPTGGQKTHSATALRASIPCSAARCAVLPAWQLEARRQWTGPTPWLPPGVYRLGRADPGDQYDTPPRLQQNDWYKSSRTHDCSLQYVAEKMTGPNPD